MCGRYSLSPQESREIMDILQQVQDKFKTGEVFPTDPVVNFGVQAAGARTFSRTISEF